MFYFNYRCIFEYRKELTTILKIEIMTLIDVKTSIEDFSQGFSLVMETLPIWSQIMKAADEKGHFASEIVERALNHKRISEKQAWVVAYFAKNNGLINA